MDIPWTPKQYGQIWDDFYSQCDEDTQITLSFRLDQLIEKGHQCREPISKPLGGQIFELRAKQARVLFYFGPERSLIFVHAITKKRSDVPRRDIEQAQRIKKAIETGKELADEITFTDQA
jgi:phage-related protein